MNTSLFFNPSTKILRILGWIIPINIRIALQTKWFLPLLVIVKRSFTCCRYLNLFETTFLQKCWARGCKRSGRIQFYVCICVAWKLCTLFDCEWWVEVNWALTQKLASQTSQTNLCYDTLHSDAVFYAATAIANYSFPHPETWCCAILTWTLNWMF